MCATSQAASEAVVQTLASCFGGLYLASLGMTVSPVFIWAHAGRVTTFVVATFLGKTLIGAGALKRFYGFPWPVAIAAGSTTGHIGTVQKKIGHSTRLLSFLFYHFLNAFFFFFLTRG
jgi:Kef-type K+ transport system membrane component KefB